MTLDRRRVYAVVAVSAVLVYLGALWNGFALDDQPIIHLNPLVHSWSGMWRAFAHSYWPESAGGEFYRPLPIATYAFDGTLTSGATWWFHLINLLWHAAASLAVAVLACRWRGEKAGLIAGLLFAVHPVHVEAVANVVGRAEIMAALFVLLSVYAALAWRSVAWSTAALILGILCKENAAVIPGLVAWGWILGLDRPSRARMAGFAAAWTAAIAVCVAVRWFVLHGYMGRGDLAQFIGADSVSVRLTAVAELADVARLLVFPLHLRIDFSPAERTLVTSTLDPRFLAGLVCTVALVALLILAWRRRQTMEAFGLGWIAISYLPVANLLIPIGVLIADRALYLPSVGIALAAGSWIARLQVPRRALAIAAGLVAAGAARTALRVPVWRSDTSVTLSIVEDSPHSYLGAQFTASILLRSGNPSRALGYYRDAAAIFPYDPRNLLGGADAALTLGHRVVADSFFAAADRLCGRCRMHYTTEAGLARARGDSAVADTLLARLARGGP
jgi:protein O-mannosyl-transferase